MNIWIIRPHNYNLLAPIGGIGQLVVQGPTVARGYLHDPERTAHAFVEGLPWLTEEFSKKHKRAYQTGDLARYTSDGSIEFLGRMDTQVKIRGHRIELSEIEYHIQVNSPSTVAFAVEVIRPRHRPTQQILAAFQWSKVSWQRTTDSVSSQLLPVSESHERAAVELTRRLSEVLPSYMVPTIYIPLSCVPASSSGKVDRKRLRSLVEALPQSELEIYSPGSASKKAPKTVMEKRLQKLWSIVLDRDPAKISSTDSFFWLGGDSILAMRLAAAARAEGIELSVADVLQHPQLLDLASILKASDLSTTSYKPFSTLEEPSEISGFLEEVVCPRLLVEPSDIEDVTKATDYQVENLSWSLLQRRGGTNYLTFDFMEPVSPERLEAACNRLVEHYAILRTVFVVHNRQVYQVILNKISFDIIHRVNIRPNTIETTTSEIMKIDLREPLHPSKALARFWLLRQGDDVTRLIFRASHLQYDGSRSSNGVESSELPTLEDRCPQRHLSQDTCILRQRLEKPKRWSSGGRHWQIRP